MKKIIAGVVACMCLMITACSSLKDDSLKEDRVLESDRTSEADNGDKVLDGNKSGTEQESQVGTKEMYTRKTKIADVIKDEVFGDYGRLIFPVESGYYSGDTLEDLNLIWYNNINPDTTVELRNRKNQRLFQRCYVKKNAGTGWKRDGFEYTGGCKKYSGIVFVGRRST